MLVLLHRLIELFDYCAVLHIRFHEYRRYRGPLDFIMAQLAQIASDSVQLAVT